METLEGYINRKNKKVPKKERNKRIKTFIVRIDYWDADDTNCDENYTIEVVAKNRDIAICIATEYFLVRRPEQQADSIFNVEVEINYDEED